MKWHGRHAREFIVCPDEEIDRNRRARRACHKNKGTLAGALGENYVRQTGSGEIAPATSAVTGTPDIITQLG